MTSFRVRLFCLSPWQAELRTEKKFGEKKRCLKIIGRCTDRRFSPRCAIGARAQRAEKNSIGTDPNHVWQLQLISSFSISFRFSTPSSTTTINDTRSTNKNTDIVGVSHTHRRTLTRSKKEAAEIRTDTQKTKMPVPFEAVSSHGTSPPPFRISQ